MFSLSKLLVLIALVVAVWYGFRWAEQVRETRRRRVTRDGPTAPPAMAEDLVKCPVCGAYVAPRSVLPCAFVECPQRR